MTGVWKRLGGIGVVALSLVLWSCTDLQEGPLGPSQKQDVLVSNTTGSGFTIVKQTDLTLGTVSGVIDQNGGKLSLGQHTLEVPSGAVSGPTTFAMTKLDGDHIAVGLTATRLLLNDVGSNGFATPVRLTLSYKNAAQMPSNEQDLSIVYLKPDGTREGRTSTVDANGKRVSAGLGHFSDYAIGFPN